MNYLKMEEETKRSNSHSIQFDSNIQITTDSVAKQETTEEGLRIDDEENMVKKKRPYPKSTSY